MQSPNNALFSKSAQSQIKQHWAGLSPTAKNLIQNLEGVATNYQKQAVKHVAHQRHEL